MHLSVGPLCRFGSAVHRGRLGVACVLLAIANRSANSPVGLNKRLFGALRGFAVRAKFELTGEVVLPIRMKTLLIAYKRRTVCE